MDVREGRAVTWVVAAGSGRAVGSYDQEAPARAHINRLAERGVRLRLFCRETDTVEVEHP